MKKYYAERHGLITKQLQIDFEELLEYFRQIYKYFCDKDYFKVAIDGVWKTNVIWTRSGANYCT